MNFNDYQNAIFIVKDQARESLIKEINKENKLLNIKVITLSELKKKWFFDYTKEAIYAISKKYDVISDVAQIYVDNLYYIKDVENENVSFLVEVKNFLDENKLLAYNPLFKKYLTNKRIVLLNLECVDKFYENIFEELKMNNEVISLSTFGDLSKKKIYKAKDKEDEISFVASSI